MPVTIASVLFLVCLLQIKHMFADYFLQTERMLAGRGEYLHVGRAQHAAVHAGLTALSLFVVGADMRFVLLIALAEWVVHFHIDWAKARITERMGVGPSDAWFWRCYGIDQTLHQLTYLVIAWAWAVSAAG